MWGRVGDHGTLGAPEGLMRVVRVALSLRAHS